MFKYFITNSDVGHYLVDKYNDTIQPEREKVVEALLSETGALGAYFAREFGTPLTLRALVFPANHEICSLDGVKTTEHPSGVAVQFDEGAQFAEHYYGAIDYVNKQLSTLPAFDDWVAKEMGATRYHIDVETRIPYMTTHQLLADGRILFCVPAGTEYQSAIKVDKRLKELTDEERLAL